MEVIYNTFLENEDDIEDSSMKKIELIFFQLTEQEKEILEKYNFKYEYTEDNKIKIKDDNFMYCTVEMDGKDKGIFLEKTKTYYNYFKYDFCSKESTETRNLVISKEGVRVELIFDKKWR